MKRFLFAALSLFAALCAAPGQASPETDAASATSVSAQTSTGVASILPGAIPVQAVPDAVWEAKPRSIHETEWTRIRLSTNNGRIVTNRTSYTAVLVSSNIAIYPDCFSGAAKADVRVVLTRSGAEVDIVLKEQLAVSPADDLKMDPQQVKIEVITEAFDTQMPAPTASTAAGSRLSAANPLSPIGGEGQGEGASTSTVAAPQSLPDSTLHFGSMRMGIGRSFLTDNETVHRRDFRFVRSNPSKCPRL